MQTLRIATRRSPLALWQAEHVAGRLRSAHPTLAVELVPMTTQGDRVQDRALAAVGGKGLFVKELELALQERRADLAVHSMKDVPSRLPDGFCIAAALARADAADAFVSLEFRRFEDLPTGARVGTSSPRRQAQLRSRRPDLQFDLLRGNVETRLKRLEERRFDAIVLACAGLGRLGLEQRITQRLAVDYCVPAVGQGVIGVECRDDDCDGRAAVAALHDAATSACLDAERAFAERLEGSCHSPIAAHAVHAGGGLALAAFIGAQDGSRSWRDTECGRIDAPASLGRLLADRMLAAGAARFLADLRADAPGP